MDPTQKMNQLLTRAQVISSIVWAVLMLVCSQVLSKSFKEISLLLICGFFVEFLLINSSKKLVKSFANKVE